MPPVTEEVKEKAKLIQSRFTGDPSYEFVHIKITKVGEGEDVQENEEQVQ